MKFNYTVLDAGSKIQKGSIEAADLKEATRLLINQGWYIKKIVPRGQFKVGWAGLNIGGIPLVEKVLFIKHLGVMIKSGINLSEALEVIADQTTSKRFKTILNSVLDKVKTGQSLANVLAKFPKIFDPLIVNIIRVGEESGTLEENLEYLANELEDRLELRRNIKTAAFYPAIILSATFGLGLILAYFVLPKINHLFKTLSFELPLTTRILIWFADLMDQHGLAIVLGIIFGLFFFQFLVTRRFFKPIWHRLLLRLPVIGSVIINYNLVIINRTLGILLKSGLTIDQSIIVATDITRNIVYQRKLKKILPQIQKGKSLADALASFKQPKRNQVFPLLMIKMINIGERSGNLDESLAYLADYFEKEVDTTTKNLTTVLEPILLLIVGLIVGFIAISVISPIYQITAKFRT